MTSLSHVLKDILKQRGLNQSHICTITDFDKSKVSRIVSGEHRCSGADLTILLAVFNDPDDKLQIAGAFLKDNLPASVISLMMRSETELKDSMHPYLSALHPTAEKATKFLIDSIPKNPEIEDFLITTAKTLGWNGDNPSTY